MGVLKIQRHLLVISQDNGQRVVVDMENVKKLIEVLQNLYDKA